MTAAVPAPCNLISNHYLAIEKEMDPYPPWIEELWKTNHAPSDEAAQEVKGLLLTPLQDLEDLDAEILDLRNRLSDLESRRDKTQKLISRYESILAPIRRVPREVLGEIFYHCLPTHRNPIMKSSDCPLLLTRVCSTWRTTAMSTPNLWDRLYLTFTDEDTLPDLNDAAEMARSGDVTYGWRNANPELVKQRTTQLLRRRYEAVKEWFSRSGARPLSISLKFTAADWYKVPYSQRPPTTPTMELLSFLASLAPRWKEFDVEAPFALYKALEDMLPVSQMATLTSFSADCPGGFIPTPPSDLQLLRAPNLRQISMRSGYSIIWSDTYRSFNRWDQLTHITCSGYFFDNEIRFIFERATNLVHYQGFISVPMVEGVYDGRISMPFLQSLSITEYIYSQCLHYIFNKINAPNLRCVKYSSQFRDEEGPIVPAQFSVHNPAPIPILPLLLKSTELTSLSINASHSRFWDLRALLRAVPSVTDLTIGDRDEEYDYPNPPALEYNDSGVLIENSWSFNDLLVAENRDGSETLLPRLTSLVTACQSVQISDNTLFDLIQSRMASKKTSALTHVKAMLYRKKERNIVDELNAYAKVVGVKIKLDFEYARERTSIHIPTSPDYGLSEDDG